MSEQLNNRLLGNIPIELYLSYESQEFFKGLGPITHAKDFIVLHLDNNTVFVPKGLCIGHLVILCLLNSDKNIKRVARYDVTTLGDVSYYGLHCFGTVASDNGYSLHMSNNEHRMDPFNLLIKFCKANDNCKNILKMLLSEETPTLPTTPITTNLFPTIETIIEGGIKSVEGMSIHSYWNEAITKIAQDRPKLLALYKSLVKMDDFDINDRNDKETTYNTLLHLVRLFFEQVRGNKDRINKNVKDCYSVSPKIALIRGYLQGQFHIDVGTEQINTKFDGFDFRCAPLFEKTIENYSRVVLQKIDAFRFRRDNLHGLFNFLIDMKRAIREYEFDRLFLELIERTDIKEIIKNGDLSWYLQEMKDTVITKTINDICDNTTLTILSKQLSK